MRSGRLLETSAEGGRLRRPEELGVQRATSVEAQMVLRVKSVAGKTLACDPLAPPLGLTADGKFALRILI